MLDKANNCRCSSKLSPPVKSYECMLDREEMFWEIQQALTASVLNLDPPCDVYTYSQTACFQLQMLYYFWQKGWNPKPTSANLTVEIPLWWLSLGCIQMRSWIVDLLTDDFSCSSDQTQIRNSVTYGSFLVMNAFGMLSKLQIKYFLNAKSLWMWPNNIEKCC